MASRPLYQWPNHSRLSLTLICLLPPVPARPKPLLCLLLESFSSNHPQQKGLQVLRLYLLKTLEGNKVITHHSLVFQVSLLLSGSKKAKHRIRINLWLMVHLVVTSRRTLERSVFASSTKPPENPTLVSGFLFAFKDCLEFMFSVYVMSREWCLYKSLNIY